MTTPIRLVFKIDGNSDSFKRSIAEAEAAIAAFQKTAKQSTRDPYFMQQELVNAHKQYAELLQKSGQFSQQQVVAKTEGRVFSDTLGRQKLTLRESVQELRRFRDEQGKINKAAREQVRIQQSVVSAHSKTATGSISATVSSPGRILGDDGKDVRSFGDSHEYATKRMEVFNETLKQGATKLVDRGKNIQWAGRQMMVGLGLPIAIAAGSASAAFLQLDKEIVRIQKVYGSELKFGEEFKAQAEMVREESMATARELAKSMGQAGDTTLKLTAEFAATGKEGKELQESVKETSRLALLGEVDNEEAMKATMSLQTAFKLDTSGLSKSIDFLNLVENQTSTTLQDLVEAIPRVGPVIHNLGGGVEELAILMTALREGGVGAAEGANALKSGLSAMIAPSKDASEAAKKFGIDLGGIVERNKGELIPMIVDLQQQLQGLNDIDKQFVLTKVFGRYQVGKLSAVFNNLFAPGSQTSKVFDIMKKDASEWRAAADQEQATIVESASRRWTIAVEEFKIALADIGESYIGPITAMVEAATGIVKMIAKLPDGVKTALVWVSAIVAALTVGIMTLGVMLNFIGTTLQFIRAVWAKITGVNPFENLTSELLVAKNLIEGFDDGFIKAADSVQVMETALRELILTIQRAQSGLLGMGTAMNIAPDSKFFNPELLGQPKQSSAGLQPVVYGNAAKNMQRAQKNGVLGKDWQVQEFESIAARPGRGVGDIAQIGLTAKFLEYRALMTNNAKSDDGVLRARANQFNAAMKTFTDSYDKLAASGKMARPEVDKLIIELINNSGAAEILRSSLAQASEATDLFTREAYMTATAVGSTRKNGSSGNILPANLIGAYLAETLDPGSGSRIGVATGERKDKGDKEARTVATAIIEDALYGGGKVSPGEVSVAGVPKAHGEHIVSATTMRDEYGIPVLNNASPIAQMHAMLGPLGLTVEEINAMMQRYGLSVTDFGEVVDMQTGEILESAKETDSTTKKTKVINKSYEASMKQLITAMVEHAYIINGQTKVNKGAIASRAKAVMSDALVGDMYDYDKIVESIDRRMKGKQKIADQDRTLKLRDRVDNLNENRYQTYAPPRQTSSQYMDAIGNVQFDLLDRISKGLILRNKEERAAARQRAIDASSGRIGGMAGITAMRYSVIGLEAVLQRTTTGAFKLAVAMSRMGSSIAQAGRSAVEFSKKHKMSVGSAMAGLGGIGMFVSPEGTGAAATASNTLSMAGMGAGMGMMLGPWGAAIGGIAGGAFGYVQKLGEASDKAADKLLEMATAIENASKVSDELVTALGANTDAQKAAFESEGSAIADAARGTGVGGDYTQKAGYSQINEVAGEMRAEFEKLTDQQAISTAMTVYSKLVNQGVAKDTAEQFIKDLLFAANKKSVIIDVTGQITAIKNGPTGQAVPRGAVVSVSPIDRYQEQQRFAGQNAQYASGSFRDGFSSQLDTNMTNFAWGRNVLDGGNLSEDMKKLLDPVSRAFAESLSSQIQTVFSQSDSWAPYAQEAGKNFGNAMLDTPMLGQLKMLTEANVGGTEKLADMGITEMNSLNELANQYLLLDATQRETFQGISSRHKEFGKIVESESDAAAQAMMDMYSPELSVMIADFAGKLSEGERGLTKYQATVYAAAMVTDQKFREAFPTMDALVQKTGSLESAIAKLSVTDPGLASKFQTLLPIVERNKTLIDEYNSSASESSQIKGPNIDKVALALAQAQMLGLNVQLDQFKGFDGTVVSVAINQRITREIEVAQMNQRVATFASEGESMFATDSELQQEEQEGVGSEASDDTAQKASDARVKAAEKEVADREKAMDKGIQDAQKAYEKQLTDAREAFEKQVQARQEAAKEEFDAAINGLRRTAEAAQKQREQEIEAVREASQQRQDQLREESEAISKMYDDKIDAINDEAEAERKREEAANRAEEAEKRRIARAKELLDLQLAMAEGAARGDAFAVLSAQMNMSNAQSNWQQEDKQIADEDTKRQKDEARDAEIKRLGEEKDAKVKAIEEVAKAEQDAYDKRIELMTAEAESKREADEQDIAWKQAVGEAMLAQRQEQDAALIEQRREYEQGLIEAFNEAAQKELEAKQAADAAEVGQEAAKNEAIKLNREEVAAAVQQAWTESGGSIQAVLDTLEQKFGLTGDTALKAFAAIRPDLSTILTLMSELGIRTGAAAELLNSLMTASASGRAMSAVRIKEIYSTAITAIRQQMPELAGPAQEELAAGMAALQQQINNSVGFGFATGGPVAGAGTPTSDSIPALLSNGEYVIKASSVSKYGRGLFDALNAQKLAAGGPVGASAGASATVIAAPGKATDNITNDLEKSVQDVGDARVAADIAAQQSDAELAAQKVASVTKLVDEYINSIKIMDGRFNEVLARQLDGIKETDKANYASFIASVIQDNELTAAKMRNYQAIRDAMAQEAIADRVLTNAKIMNDAILAKQKSDSLTRYMMQHAMSESEMSNQTRVRAALTIQSLQAIANTNREVTDSSTIQWAMWANATKTQMTAVADHLKSSFAGINYDALVKMVEAYASGKTSEGDALKSQVLKKADGGYISGPGTGTSDSIPALLSNGEYVIRQRSVQKYGASFLNEINAGRFAEGGMVGALSTSVSDMVNKAIERKIQEAITRRSPDFAEGSTGTIIDWSKVPPGGYSNPFGYWTTYSGGNHGSDGRGARDYQAPLGAGIRPAGPGVVSRVTGGSYPDTGNPNDGGGGGNWAIIDHNIPGKGVYSSVYMHMKQGSMKVRPGDVVDTTKIIGGVGNSGSSTGPHLHFEFAPGGGQVQRAMTNIFESVTGATPVSFRNSVTGESGGPGMFSFASSKIDMSKIGSKPSSWKFTSGSPDSYSGSTGTPWNGAPIPGISPNVMRWATLVQDTMKELNIPSKYISGILRQMQQESGGNPNAVNNWDSNALAGTPSKGLLQTIVPTFLSYARANQRDPNLVTDPSANVYAALNYVLGRYGMSKFELWNAGFNQGYAGGGLVIPALRRGATINYDNTLANLHRGETVLTAPLTKRLQENVASSGETSYNVVVKIDKASATAQEIEDAVFGALDKHSRRSGRSRVVGVR